MEYAQPFAGPVLLVYAILGAIIAFARFRVETGDWTEIHTAERSGPLPSEASYEVKTALTDGGVPCKLRVTHAQLASGGTQAATVALVRPHQTEAARRILQALGPHAE